MKCRALCYVNTCLAHHYNLVAINFIFICPKELLLRHKYMLFLDHACYFTLHIICTLDYEMLFEIICFCV